MIEEAKKKKMIALGPNSSGGRKAGGQDIEALRDDLAYLRGQMDVVMKMKTDVGGAVEEIREWCEADPKDPAKKDHVKKIGQPTKGK